jgi:hypothetical protein
MDVTEIAEFTNLNGGPTYFWPYSVGAQVERNVTRHWHNQYCLAQSYLHLTVANKSFFWTNSSMFIPVLFHFVPFKIFFKQQNQRNEYTPDHTQTVHSSHIQTAWSFWSFDNSFSHLRVLLLSPFPFACGLQCTTHQLSVTRRKNLSRPNLHIINTNRYTKPTSW